VVIHRYHMKVNHFRCEKGAGAWRSALSQNASGWWCLGRCGHDDDGGGKEICLPWMSVCCCKRERKRAQQAQQ
jgi:hypothetical protein